MLLKNFSKSEQDAEPAISRQRMPELDTVRGIAILLVVIFHCFESLKPSPTAPRWEKLFILATGGGWTGVNLFFVLSGFLITGILLDSREEPGFFLDFYYRRSLRILPTYYAVLLILVGISHLSFVHRRVSWAFAGLSIAYLANVTPLLGVPMQFGPFWSLAVEEHFYLVWPMAAKVLSRRGLLLLAGTICLVEPFLRWFTAGRGGLWFGPYTWLSADGLALGALIAIFARSKYANRKNLLKIAVLGFVSGVAAILLSFAVSHPATKALRGTGVNYFAFFAVAISLWIGTGKWKTWVRWRVLSFLGFVSYGLYLVHVVVIDLYGDVTEAFLPTATLSSSFEYACIRFAVVFLISVGLAYLSRVTYEEFFLRQRHRNFSQQRSPRAVSL